MVALPPLPMRNASLVSVGTPIERRVGSSATKNKRARGLLLELSKVAATYSPTNAVPSALLSLMTLFGMGRDGTSAL